MFSKKQIHLISTTMRFVGFSLLMAGVYFHLAVRIPHSDLLSYGCVISGAGHIIGSIYLILSSNHGNNN